MTLKFCFRIQHRWEMPISMELDVDLQPPTASAVSRVAAPWSNALKTGLKCLPSIWTECWDSTEVSLQFWELSTVTFCPTGTSLAPLDLQCGGILIFSILLTKTVTRTQYHSAGSSTRRCYRPSVESKQICGLSPAWESSTQSGDHWLFLTSYYK